MWHIYLSFIVTEVDWRGPTCSDVPSAGFSLCGGGSRGLSLLLLGELDGHSHLAQVDGVLPGFGLSLLLHCRNRQHLYST